MYSFIPVLALILLGVVFLQYNGYIRRRENRKTVLKSEEAKTSMIDEIFHGLLLHREFHDNQVLTLYEARRMTEEELALEGTVINQSFRDLEEAEERKYLHHLREIHNGHF
jgi:hypothetical protein